MVILAVNKTTSSYFTAYTVSDMTPWITSIAPDTGPNFSSVALTEHLFNGDPLNSTPVAPRLVECNAAHSICYEPQNFVSSSDTTANFTLYRD